MKFLKNDMTIKKILIANRGEIALRIIRNCKEMGIKTVALCPLPGQESDFLETSLADEYYFLEKEGAAGYLDGKKIVEIAKKAKVEAIHPGYGFLAENWKFAKLCKKNGIKFIGPHFKTLKKLEDKIEAKKIAQKVGIPTLLASDESIKTKDDLFKWALRIRPPFVLKARKGGGGIGIRVVNGQISFGELFSTALSLQRQIGLAFSEVDFFLEKYLPEVKHIEFQILGDGENFLHLGERECSIQRRFQKLVEEAPSLFLDEKKREEMGELAIKLAKELKYRGVGTVEFLMTPDKKFYFMEVNPRLQVEHPVTEAITGIDLVEQQIRICQGEKIKFSQEDISFSGWAMELRINAEDPLKNFQPSSGKIEKYFPPGGQGIFLHTFLHEGQEIYPYFDSLLAKLISWGKNREEAISKLKRTLTEFIIEGVATNIPFFKVLLENEDFLKGKFTTDFIEKSGILRELKPEVQKRIKIKEKIEEEEIAEIIYQIYQALKSSQIPPEKEVSNWKMAERLKLYEI
ncbi:MAG: biotin carboxylase N-terminal domain-containing protein [Patescibacteria group bacterium]|nr:biotin carboxylase N-terminal domain-containing protein [Patescibacteria group bacterium]